MLHTHLAIRDDAHVLYGFHEEDERAVFLKLISVSGVGASIGRMILSSMNASEIRQAIFNEDVAAIKSVKGVGAKTAERIIVDLKDKIFREDPSQLEKVTSGYNTTKSEALSALSSLGFDKKKAEKTLESILKQHGDDIAVELLIKYALKQL
jgi:holliday junction DNA helicase RuvA